MEVCRSCMNSSLSLVDIFSEQPLPNDQSSLADMVNKLVACEVIRGDEFPQKMCESCCINVQIAFRFKLQFEQCYQLLSLQIKQIQLDPLEIKIEVDSQETSTKRSNTNRFESSSGVSLSRRTNEAEMNLNTSHHIDGLGRSVSSTNEFSVFHMEGENSTMLIENEMVRDQDNAMSQDNSSLDSEKVRSIHKLKHTEKRPFKCEKCPATFSWKSTLSQHKHYHTEKYKCKLCSAHLANKRNFTSHMISHTDERPFKCTHCDKGFIQKKFFKAHIQTHSGERPFKCSHCNKSFVQKNCLRMHNRIHTGEHPYKCEECPMTFRRVSSLKIHRFQHAEERPYSCDQCPKTFVQKRSLNTHMTCHSGEWPFKCSYCNKGFRYKLSLETHSRLHTGELPYKCEECVAKYTQWNNLDEKERKLKDKPIKMAFKSRRHLVKHIQTVHKVELDQLSRVQKPLETV